MHRRLLKPLASTMGAVALVVAPMALLAPSAQAAPIVLDEDNADDSVATVKGPDGTNQVSYWVAYLAERDIMGATCVKVTPSSKIKEWAIPAPPAGTQFALVTSKAANENALEDEQYPNQVWWAPKAAEGNIVTAVAGKNISHVIWCTVPKTTEPPTTKPPVTGPPVETDRVADTGSEAGLALALGATALVAGGGAIVVSRRRQGADR